MSTTDSLLIWLNMSYYCDVTTQTVQPQYGVIIVFNLLVHTVIQENVNITLLQFSTYKLQKETGKMFGSQAYPVHSSSKVNIPNEPTFVWILL